MTKHGRNCTAGTVYTYHERQRDSKTSGYGSKSVRLGKDSVKEFDCCCLTLQPCRDPVVTPSGYLYDREAILKNILHQKRTIAHQLKQFAKQQTKQQSELAELSRAEQETKTKEFIQRETNPVKQAIEQRAASTSATAAASISNMKAGSSKQLPSFWIPSLTPDSNPTLIKKPDEKVRCPNSGAVLRIKDLIPVKFTHVKDGDEKTSLIAKQVRYVCAVTNDVLGNSVPCAVLRPSGSVVTMECVEKLIKKDMLDPIGGQKLKESDIIMLQRGATGFSGAGVTLKAKKEGAAMQA